MLFGKFPVPSMRCLPTTSWAAKLVKACVTRFLQFVLSVYLLEKLSLIYILIRIFFFLSQISSLWNISVSLNHKFIKKDDLFI